MSSREPMWYCHECNAEMRPLMIPDPHCASCNGTFVERIENPSDDPRDFRLAEAGHWEDGALPGEMDGFLAGLRSMVQGPNPVPRRPTSPSSGGGASGGAGGRRPSSDRSRSPSNPQIHPTGHNGQFTIRIEHSSTPGGRSRTVILGGNPGRNNDDIPMLSQFGPPRPGNGNEQDRPNITGPMLAQYLLALMGPSRGGDPFANMLGGMFGPGGAPHDGPEGGRWGDYVFNQEALDQIITQIMENNNAHQPVPASEDVVEKLPRVIIEEDSPLLDKECAVCKEQFNIKPEDEAEKVVITLPCKHSFHEPCILPWLKTSGTCPVCRYQLVPQPDPHATRPGPSPSGARRSSSFSSTSGGNGNGGGVLHNMFNLFSSNHGNHGAQEGSGSNSSGSSNSNPATTSGSAQSSRQNRNHNYGVPGAWDQID